MSLEDMPGAMSDALPCAMAFDDAAPEEKNEIDVRAAGAPLSIIELEVGHSAAYDPAKASPLTRSIVAIANRCTDISAFVVYPAITLVILVDVIGRNFFQQPLSWATEGSGLFLIMAIYLVACNVEQTKTHITLDLLSSRYGTWGKWALDLFTTTLAGWWACMVTVRSCMEISTSIEMMESGQDWVYPYWPIRVVMSFAFFVLAVFLIIQCCEIISRPFRKESRNA